MRMWDYLDKYIRVATWPPQTKIPDSAPIYIYIYIYIYMQREREREAIILQTFKNYRNQTGK